MINLMTDILLGVISLFFLIFGLSIGAISFLMLSIPRIDFPTGVISSLTKFIPWIKARRFFDRYLLGRQPDPDFCRRLLIGLLGANLSFVITLLPLVFFYDIRMYLFFFGLDMFFGALALAYYRIFVCYPRK